MFKGGCKKFLENRTVSKISQEGSFRLEKCFFLTENTKNPKQWVEKNQKIITQCRKTQRGTAYPVFETMASLPRSMASS